MNISEQSRNRDKIVQFDFSRSRVRRFFNSLINDGMARAWTGRRQPGANDLTAVRRFDTLTLSENENI